MADERCEDSCTSRHRSSEAGGGTSACTALLEAGDLQSMCQRGWRLLMIVQGGVEELLSNYCSFASEVNIFIF